MAINRGRKPRERPFSFGAIGKPLFPPLRKIRDWRRSLINRAHHRRHHLIRPSHQKNGAFRIQGDLLTVACVALLCWQNPPQFCSPLLGSPRGGIENGPADPTTTCSFSWVPLDDQQRYIFCVLRLRPCPCLQCVAWPYRIVAVFFLHIHAGKLLKTRQCM